MGTEPAPGTPQPSRDVDSTRLKGLSHPLRLTILDLLHTHGELTASRLAELVGESSGSTSYHLRQLAKHDFVTEVEGRGTARERWWKATPGGYSIRIDDEDDVGTRTAKSLVNAESERSRQAKVWRLLEEIGRTDPADPRTARWRDAITLDTAHLWATPEQMEDVIAAYHRFVEEHLLPLRGQEGTPGAVPVQIHFNAFPLVDELPGEPPTD
ncbi:helix-turn-helix domain-containing protein [Isoptericola chiayiensis]|uniref:Helix-turn-helix domain-containing protein n=1 Tax=Isoptericola chiayiensis TaxID=579446 RepID=A0ABP8Y4R7_9MICO|nr:winged helix-turn-helix domain-containing protein [Isoptericola chiayiensis]NOV99408.1 DNA-binding transcriptional ArsR family regulator [Isoptericola chiayiensis]